jgi:hypothetical protein
MSIGNGLRDMPYNLGRDPGLCTPTYYQGLIDDVRVYSRALSDSEIKAIYEATK